MINKDIILIQKLCFHGRFYPKMSLRQIFYMERTFIIYILKLQNNEMYIKLFIFDIYEILE